MKESTAPRVTDRLSIRRPRARIVSTRSARAPRSEWRRMETHMDDLEKLRYPVGRHVRRPAPFDARDRAALIDVIEQAPPRFRALAGGLNDAQLDTPYR